MLAHDSTFTLFDNAKLTKKIKNYQLDEKYKDPFYLERKETTIDALRGNLLIFTNLDANNNQKATEIRILNNYTIEEQMDKGLNSRRIKAIEQYFKKRKLNQFSLEKLKIKTLKITSGVIAFMQVSDAFFFDLELNPPKIRGQYKDKEMQYGYYWSLNFKTPYIIGGFVKCENGIYDVYRCSVDYEYKVEKNKTTILKKADLELNFPCCTNKIPINDLKFVKRWGVDYVHCENCDKHYSNRSFSAKLITKIGGKKINKKLKLIESLWHHPLWDFIIKENKKDEEEVDNEYGYIVKLRSEKLTDKNMGFMF